MPLPATGFGYSCLYHLRSGSGRGIYFNNVPVQYLGPFTEMLQPFLNTVPSQVQTGIFCSISIFALYERGTKNYGYELIVVKMFQRAINESLHYYQHHFFGIQEKIGCTAPDPRIRQGIHLI
jgi:hypothetical protein